MAGARAGSAPPGPRDTGASGPRRSHSAGGTAPPTPRLRPLFLWVRQDDTSVLQVHCEDYDPANRLRFSKTPLGWRVIPRSETFDAIKLPRAPSFSVPRRTRTKRRSRPTHRRPRPRAIDRAPPSRLHRPPPSSTELQPDKHLADSKETILTNVSENIEDLSENKENTWSLPDLEISIPSHTIHVPQRLDKCKERFVAESNSLSENEFNPTPLDKLLAVAELEFNQQQSSSSSLEDASPCEEDINTDFSKFQYLSEECQRELATFSVDNKEENAENSEEDYFTQKISSNTDEKTTEEDQVFQDGMVAAKDLFETITESHYIPMDLVNSHDQDEAINANELLDSLVEKGCEDNHIIGTDFDKIAQIVSEEDQMEGDYEDDEEMLMDDAPVSDIINRLEQSLDSPSQHSIAAAQGLLHLQDMTDDLSHLQESQEKIDSLVEHLNKPEEFIPVEADMACSIDNVTDVPKNDANNDDNESDRTVNTINSDETIINKDSELELDTEIDNVTSNTNNPDLENDFVDHTERDSEGYLSGEPSDPEVPDTTKEMSSNVDEDQLDAVSNRGTIQSDKDSDNNEYDDEMVPTDLSINIHDKEEGTLNHRITADDLPKDLSCRKRPASPYRTPRRIETPRPLSRGSDTVQSPQPSGIPAVPSSPELQTSNQNKSNKSLFLESLLSSPSPKMCFSSELTITKHQNEPLNLGKSRKSASPTVSSCSEEVKKPRIFSEEEKQYKNVCDEPPLEKLNKLFSKSSESSLDKPNKNDRSKRHEELSPIEQLQLLRCSTEFELPDPLLIPKDKFSAMLMSPAKEIPALLHKRPELRIPEAFTIPSVLQDPDILVVSLNQFETILVKHQAVMEKDRHKEQKQSKPATASTPSSTTENKKTKSTPVTTLAESSNRPLATSSAADSMAGDIDAATQAALGQMLWLPYLSQFEAAMACSQNADILKALHSPVQTSFTQQPAYPDMNQMFLSQARFMNPANLPGLPSLDYNNQLELAMWQEAMSHNNSANMQQRSHKSYHSSENAFLKNMEAQNFLAQAAKMQHYQQQQNRGHSARTSPVTRGYRSGSSSSMGSMPSPGVASLPSFPWMAYPTRPHLSSHGPPQYSPGGARSRHQQPPRSPSSYYHNNNYLGLSKHGSRERSSSGSSSKEVAGDPQQGQQRPRITVKSLQNLLESPAEVGSSTHPPEEVSSGQEPHTPLWHPLFGNQKNYSSPWNWTTVTVNGD